MNPEVPAHLIRGIRREYQIRGAVGAIMLGVGVAAVIFGLLVGEPLAIVASVGVAVASSVFLAAMLATVSATLGGYRRQRIRRVGRALAGAALLALAWALGVLVAGFVAGEGTMAVLLACPLTLVSGVAVSSAQRVGRLP